MGDTGDDLGGVRAYYDSTWFDYRALWLNPANRAIHFGWWGPGVRTHARSLVAMNELMADAARVQPGDVVLDAGCGVGGTAMWLAEHRGASVVGITPVAGQVERARRYAGERDLGERVRFEQGDYRDVPLPDASVDVVWFQESLVHSAEKERVFREAARVLRPGGRVVVAEYLRVGRPLSPHQERLLDVWCRGWAMGDLASGFELVAAAERAGLVEVGLRDLTAEMRRSLRRLFVMTTGLFPVALGLHVTAVRDDAAHGNVVGARAQWKALRSGAWFYGLLTAAKP